MKLRDFKNMIDQAAAFAGEADVDVEVCCVDKDGNELPMALEIVRVGHFHIVPDVVITVQRTDDNTNQNAGQNRV